MRFFGREREIDILRRERTLSHKSARFTVVTGRRRVGKTELIERALNDGKDDYLYLSQEFGGDYATYFSISTRSSEMRHA